MVAIAHKVVSKAEGAVVALARRAPRARARRSGRLAASRRARTPRVVQVVLDQSAEVLRAERGVLICRTRHGFVCANAGVDASNATREHAVVLLPRDPDASARRIRARLRELTGAAPAVLISDSFGRAWRHGQFDVAIGLAGMQPAGRLARADRRARPGAAGHLAGRRRRRRRDWPTLRAPRTRASPVVILDGLERYVTAEDGPGAAALLRPLAEDLFR